MRIEKLKEEEEKFLLSEINKSSIWDKEQVVFQWYETDQSKENFESKFKLIFDMINISMKAVRVEKHRTSQSKSEKKVYYLNMEEISLFDLLNKPFVAKRRSINNNIFLDFFIKSNHICSYLLEIENQYDQNPMSTDEYTILKNVTKDEAYLNRNMSIPFLENDLLELEFLIKFFRR